MAMVLKTPLRRLSIKSEDDILPIQKDRAEIEKVATLREEWADFTPMTAFLYDPLFELRH